MFSTPDCIARALTDGYTGQAELDLADAHDEPMCASCRSSWSAGADWTGPLINAGYRPHQPTAWLVEGLLIYLSSEQAATLVTTIGNLSTPGSQIAFEHGNLGADTMRAQARGMPTMAAYAAMWKGSPDAQSWLTDHGWHTTLHDRTRVASSYGRKVTAPIPGGFVTAIRRNA